MRLTTSEACKRYGITPRTLLRLVRMGLARRAGFAASGEMRYECGKLESRQWGGRRGFRAERKAVQ